VIETHGLAVRYPEAHGLRSVDLSIPAGSFVLVGGPSGGGKTTLAHALMGLIPQTVPAEVTGRVSVAGLDPRQHSVARLATRAGLVFQNPASQLFNGTVTEEVAFGPRNLGLGPEEVADRVAYALEAVGCAHLRHRTVRHLSGGEQQRVAIAAVLAMRPSALILDEPAANLDTEGIRLLVETLVRLQRQSSREKPVTLVVIEHRLAPFLPHADRLVWLAEGQVVADGPPAATLARLQLAPAAHLPPPAPSDAPLVTLQGITAGYNGRPILRDCSFTLHQGDFAALVGPNGSGKTTLARVLAGVLRPRRGRVVWHAGRRSRRVGLLQQNPLHQLVCDTVAEEICFSVGNRGIAGDGKVDAEVDAVLTQTDLLALRDRPIQTLSAGQQQRAALAATLSVQPALLILDEPTVGQDRRHLIQVMDFVAELNRTGQTVLLITHDGELVERYAGRVWEVGGRGVRKRE
jgi:energy-coupling factor transporter ATP-binding protein EcfA2